LSKILRELGYTVSQFHGSLMAELSDVEYYLKNIAVRLKELQLGIEASYKDQQDSYTENASLASNIAEQTRTIAHGFTHENDLAALKTLIDDGLQKIGTRVQSHLERDRERVEKGEKRLEVLSKRLKRMDEESTRLRAQVRQERERAQQDALTGVPNRAAFDGRIGAEIARHNRHARKLSLAVIDIDNFKRVNDRFGHKAGDKVLKSVAEICAANVRASDFLARYGGEEFVLVLPETPIEQALHVAEKLRGEIAAKGFYYENDRVPITVSIGIAQFAENESADEVFGRADAALYAAKAVGRNRCMTQT
jgi:diguanylate cyclase